MPKFFTRIVVFLLVPCLVVNSASAATYSISIGQWRRTWEHTTNDFFEEQAFANAATLELHSLSPVGPTVEKMAGRLETPTATLPAKSFHQDALDSYRLLIDKLLRGTPEGEREQIAQSMASRTFHAPVWVLPSIVGVLYWSSAILGFLLDPPTPDRFVTSFIIILVASSLTIAGVYSAAHGAYFRCPPLDHIIVNSSDPLDRRRRTYTHEGMHSLYYHGFIRTDAVAHAAELLSYLDERYPVSEPIAADVLGPSSFWNIIEVKEEVPAVNAGFHHMTAALIELINPQLRDEAVQAAESRMADRRDWFLIGENRSQMARIEGLIAAVRTRYPSNVAWSLLSDIANDSSPAEAVLRFLEKLSAAARVAAEKEKLAHIVLPMADEVYQEIANHFKRNADQIYRLGYCTLVHPALRDKVATLGEAQVFYEPDPDDEHELQSCIGLKTSTGRWVIDANWQVQLPEEKRGSHLPKVLILEASELGEGGILSDLGVPTYVRRLYQKAANFDSAAAPGSERTGRTKARDYQMLAESAAVVRNYAEHEEKIDQRWLAAAFDERQTWIHPRQLFSDERSVQLVRRFLRAVGGPGVRDAFDNLVLAPAGRVGIRRIEINGDPPSEWGAPPYGHASDRGLYVFVNIRKPISAEEEAARIVHEFLAYMGQPHYASVAYEMTFRTWKKEGEHLQNLAITNALYEDRLSAENDPDAPPKLMLVKALNDAKAAIEKMMVSGGRPLRLLHELSFQETVRQAVELLLSELWGKDRLLDVYIKALDADIRLAVKSPEMDVAKAVLKAFEFNPTFTKIELLRILDLVQKKMEGSMKMKKGALTEQRPRRDYALDSKPPTMNNDAAVPELTDRHIIYEERVNIELAQPVMSIEQLKNQGKRFQIPAALIQSKLLEAGLKTDKRDVTFIQLVFGHLVANAIDAVNAAGLTQSPVAIAIVREGPNLILEVEDRGIGIPPDKLVKILEEEFTTKFTAKEIFLGKNGEGAMWALWAAKQLHFLQIEIDTRYVGRDESQKKIYTQGSEVRIVTGSRSTPGTLWRVIIPGSQWAAESVPNSAAAAQESKRRLGGGITSFDSDSEVKNLFDHPYSDGFPDTRRDPLMGTRDHHIRGYRRSKNRTSPAAASAFTKTGPRTLDSFPNYVNLSALAALKLTVSESVRQKAHIGLLWEYRFGAHGYASIDDYSETPQKQRCDLQIYSFIPELPQDRHIGQTLLWLLLVYKNHWAGRHVYVHNASPSLGHVLDRMSDFSALPGKLRKTHSPHGPGYSYDFLVPSLSPVLEQEVEQFIQEKMLWRTVVDGISKPGAAAPSNQIEIEEVPAALWVLVKRGVHEIANQAFRSTLPGIKNPHVEYRDLTPQSWVLVMKSAGVLIGYAIGKPLEAEQDGVEQDENYGKHNTVYRIAHALLPAFQGLGYSLTLREAFLMSAMRRGYMYVTAHRLKGIPLHEGDTMVSEHPKWVGNKTYEYIRTSIQTSLSRRAA